MNGITFDTGALIALERRRASMARVYTTAVDAGVPIIAPAVVIAEWWRGASNTRERILRGVRIEQTDTQLMKAAGEALATMRSATVVDAIVMASAARRGNVVYTADVDDLEALGAFFRGVRVLSC
jgi:predicted nucleic acid-binding protein